MPNFLGAPEKSRTPNLQIRSPLLEHKTAKFLGSRLIFFLSILSFFLSIFTHKIAQVDTKNEHKKVT